METIQIKREELNLLLSLTFLFLNMNERNEISNDERELLLIMTGKLYNLFINEDDPTTLYLYKDEKQILTSILESGMERIMTSIGESFPDIEDETDFEGFLQTHLNEISTLMRKLN